MTRVGVTQARVGATSRFRRTVGLLVVLACAGDETAAKPASDPSAASVVADSTPSPAATAGTPGGRCPTYGLWQACSVEDRISRAGLAVRRREDGVTHDFMHVAGLVWETSRAEIQVFLYPTEAARKRDTDTLDTLTVSPPGKRVSWPRPATLVTSQNLAAIILSVNPRQSERIALALGAGLPAAPR